MHRLAHFKKFPRGLLRRHAGFLDQLDIGPCAAVADGRLIGVHLHDRVVHTHPGQRGEHVLDRVHSHTAFANRRRALDCFEVVDLRLNQRLISQIFAPEFDPVLGRCGLQLQRHLLAGMQRCAAESSGFGQSLLHFACHASAN